uniref:NADH dehydrogenase subunit 4L n=1 Tax=Blattisocius keegani TaxID=2337216 RepID=A0A4Y5QDR2_9ACAR|nr:NADH dehydrogenase subunit 4L [Blattisocius keegani]
MLLFFFLGLMVILFESLSLLMILVNLELLVVSLFMIMNIKFYENSFVEIITFLVFSVLEALLGLVSLVIKIMVMGNDLVILNDIL